MYTIREGKITEINPNDLKSNESSFDTRIKAVQYMVNTGNTHNLSKDDRKLFDKELKDLSIKKGYQLFKELDSSYTILNNKSREETKNNVSERNIFKELNSLENLNSHERKIAEMRHYGNMNDLENLKHTVDRELERSYGKMAELTKEQEFYSDPKRGNDPERAQHISSELHTKENQFKDLIEVSKTYDVKIANTYHDLDREIRLREKDTISTDRTSNTQANMKKEVSSPTLKIDVSKTIKAFKAQAQPTKNIQKSRGMER